MSDRGQAVRLPQQFAELQPFVERWAVAGIGNRAASRDESSEEDRLAFYSAAKELILPVLDYLDAKPIDQLDPAETALLHMTLAYVHVSLAVELQQDAEPVHTVMRQHMRITHEPVR
jgi:hypothetical protein